MEPGKWKEEGRNCQLGQRPVPQPGIERYEALQKLAHRMVAMRQPDEAVAHEEVLRIAKENQELGESDQGEIDSGSHSDAGVAANCFWNAEKRTRTSTPLRELEPESSASANSAISARICKSMFLVWRCQ
jgi:hypothetical protein